MAKNFGQKFIALQLGMLLLGALLFLGGYALKKSLSADDAPETVSAQEDIIAAPDDLR